MSDDEVSHEELEQALRDERSMRYRVEQRNTELNQRIDVWRSRAEERTARIDQLERERDIPWLRHVRNRIRRIMREEPVGVSPHPHPAPVVDRPSLAPQLPIVRTATCLNAESMTPLAETVSAVDLDAIAGADVVVIEPAALGTRPESARNALADWSRLPGRQPLVVWTADDTIGALADLLRPGDVVAATTRRAASALGHRLGRPVEHAPPTFDPAMHSPLRIADAPKPRTVTEGDVADPPHWLVRQAACGLGSDDAGGVALRRWAFRRHAPWVRARQLFEATGLALPNPTDPITGILVTNRPEHAAAAVQRISTQRTPGFRLAIGLHGFEPGDDLRSAIDGSPMATSVTPLPASYTLGECLNAVIAANPGRLLAKIDDDDYYGPSYLDDALHAQAYSGAELIGKGAHYTYLGGTDRTVLRRPTLEERFIDTMTTGASLVFDRAVWDAVRFPHRTVQEDTWFLGAVRSIGAKVYANTRFEFTYVRSGSNHTWQTDEATFEAGSEPAWDGLHPERAFVSDLD